MALPTSLMINAWIGDGAATGNLAAKAKGWIVSTKGEPLKFQQKLAADDVELRDWSNSKVGWGVILPHRTDLSPADLAAAKDAPEPIQTLVQERNGLVLRYLSRSKKRFEVLASFASGKRADLDISSAPIGRGPGQLPLYLLIYAEPSVIPWQLQYILNTTRTVGRLDLTGTALENYVQALRGNWSTAAAQVNRALIWSVDLGAQDITNLMRRAIATQVFGDLDADTDLHNKVQYIDGSKTVASAATLLAALSSERPALIVTTSHGQTGPLNDLDRMRATLGLPVDQEGQALDVDSVLAAWQPDGAIWYAHACCSAGSDATSQFVGLLADGSPIDLVLKGVAKLGAMMAPLPRALLGAKKPLRAFIGHVEPTFDWTLRRPDTHQYLTAPLQTALYTNLYNKIRGRWGWHFAISTGQSARLRSSIKHRCKILITKESCATSSRRSICKAQ
jgi:hypothetical protein